MTLRNLTRGRQRGISLVEMGIAIAVLAVLLVGVFLGYRKVQMDSYMQKARLEIPLTVAAISMSAMTQPNTNGINTQIMSLLNAWPKDRVTNAGQSTVKVAGPFPGSTEQVFGYAYSNGTRLRVGWSGFAYWINNVPEDACLPLLQLLVAQRSVVNLTAGSMSLNKTPNSTNMAGSAWLASTASNGTISLNMGNATTWCANSPGTNKQIHVLIAREG
jgi:hypothetical protein